MSSANKLESYRPPKNQAVSKVYRFPVYERPAPEPAPAPPPIEESPKEEPPAPASSTWSEWEYIKSPQWEGYWRASPLEDGGWHYHLTKDGKTIWEQKVSKPEAAKPEAPKATTASAKTDGEPRVSGLIPATAFTTALDTSVENPIGYTSTNDDTSNTPTHGAVSSLSSRDQCILTVEGHSRHSNIETQHATSTQTASASGEHKSQDRGTSTRDSHNIDAGIQRGYQRKHTILHGEEAETTRAPSAPQEGGRNHHPHNKKRQVHHGTTARSWEADRHQNALGQVVDEEKNKKFNAEDIVNKWQLG